MVWRAGLGMLLAVGLAGAAEAAPFALAPDGQDGVWVLDEAGGAVSWCRLVTPAGPKLVDVFGDNAVREGRARAARPECVRVAPGSDDAGPEALAALLAEDGVADADGRWSWPGWLPDRRIVGGRAGRDDVGGGSDRGDVDAGHRLP